MKDDISVAGRYFIVDREGVPRRMRADHCRGLYDGTKAAPEWAAMPVLFAEVLVRCEERRPVRIVRSLYKRYTVDAGGHSDWAAWQNASLGWEVVGEELLPPVPGAPQGRVRFLKKQYESFIRTPTAQQDRIIAEALYGRTVPPPRRPSPRKGA